MASERTERFKVVDGRVVVKTEDIVELPIEAKDCENVNTSRLQSTVSSQRTKLAAAKIIRKKTRFIKWSSDESQLLFELVKESDHDQINWDEVSRHFPSRSTQLVKLRWELVQNPRLKKGSWSHGEDTRILAGIRDGEQPANISRELSRPFNSGGLRLRCLCKYLFGKMAGTRELCEWLMEEKKSMTNEEIEEEVSTLHPNKRCKGSLVCLCSRRPLLGGKR